jgi:hypothetical protein
MNRSYSEVASGKNSVKSSEEKKMITEKASFSGFILKPDVPKWTGDFEVRMTGPISYTESQLCITEEKDRAFVYLLKSNGTFKRCEYMYGSNNARNFTSKPAFDLYMRNGSDIYNTGRNRSYSNSFLPDIDSPVLIYDHRAPTAVTCISKQPSTDNIAFAADYKHQIGSIIRMTTPENNDSFRDLFTLRDPNGFVKSMHFCSNGSLISHGRLHHRENSIKLRDACLKDVQTTYVDSSIEESTMMNNIFYGAKSISIEEMKIFSYDPRTGECIDRATIDDSVCFTCRSLCPLPDGRILVLIDGGVVMFDPKTNHVNRLSKKYNIRSGGWMMENISIDKNGDFIVAASRPDPKDPYNIFSTIKKNPEYLMKLL